MCSHEFKPLDVEKRVEKHRWSNTFFRTTRLFCTKCGVQKETSERLEKGFNEERPDWTYNI